MSIEPRMEHLNAVQMVRKEKSRIMKNELSKITDVDFRESRAACNFKPLCPIKINGTPVFALIDSGNVVVNAISEKFAKELFGQDYMTHIQPLRNYTHVGTAEKGAKMRVLGITKKTLPLRFGGVSMQFHTRPIVIQGLTTSINISGPFLAENGIDQLHSKGALRIKGKLVKLMTYRNVETNDQKSMKKRLHAIEQRMSTLHKKK